MAPLKDFSLIWDKIFNKFHEGFLQFTFKSYKPLSYSFKKSNYYNFLKIKFI